MTVQNNTAESLLSKINGAQDIRSLPREALPRLCGEVRDCLIDTVSKTAGHLASGLGVVELTVALHYVFDTPNDILVWDVGHQAYPHKILTGHRDEFPTIRQPGGLHAFIWRNETPYDLISTGHASTSIGSALGLAVAQRFKPAAQRRKVIAIIGDGAISGGCAFEALNHAGSFKDLDLTIILNDNEWSISENVGSIAQGLSHIISNPHYVKLIEGGKRILKSLPTVRDLALRAQEHVKGMLMPGTLFEEFGFNYMGPVDGHDINRLVNLLQNIKEMNGLNFLHIVTTKGKGYAPAEKDPTCYHGVPTFNPVTGIQAGDHCEDKSYSNAFGRWMCDRAQIDRKLVGITPAMRVGSGMSEFAQKFPHQFFDVAIAEQHAMVFASGLAADGMRPVVNIYSSFMQRAYDGLIHDLAIQDLPVILTLDRGGVVGPDGPTHNGSFDIAYTRTVPNLVIMTPSSRRELYYMLNTAYQFAHPVVIRYPRASGESFSEEALSQYKEAHDGQKMLSLDECIEIGQVECLHLAAFHQARLAQDAKLRAEKLASLQSQQSKTEVTAKVIGDRTNAHPLCGLYADPILPVAPSLEALLGLNVTAASLWSCPQPQKVTTDAQVQDALQGKKVAVLAFGPMAHQMQPIAEAYDFTLINMRFIKPLNEELISYLAGIYDLIVTYEEGSVLGGIGEHIAALVSRLPQSKSQVLTLGLPDHFMMEGPRDLLLQENGLDNFGVLHSIMQSFHLAS